MTTILDNLSHIPYVLMRHPWQKWFPVTHPLVLRVLGIADPDPVVGVVDEVDLGVDLPADRVDLGTRGQSKVKVTGRGRGRAYLMLDELERADLPEDGLEDLVEDRPPRAVRVVVLELWEAVDEG